jgi:hypothetical protein
MELEKDSVRAVSGFRRCEVEGNFDVERGFPSIFPQHALVKTHPLGEALENFLTSCQINRFGEALSNFLHLCPKIDRDRRSPCKNFSSYPYDVFRLSQG